MDSRIENISFQLRYKLPQCLLEERDRNRRLFERQLKRHGDSGPQVNAGSKLAGEGLGEVQSCARAPGIGEDDIQLKRPRRKPRSRFPDYRLARKVRYRFVV
jgi:hypothetical protein